MKNIRQKWVFGWINLFVCKSYIQSYSLDMTCFFSATLKHWTSNNMKCESGDGAVNGLFGEWDPIFVVVEKYMQTLVDLAVIFTLTKSNGKTMKLIQFKLKQKWAFSFSAFCEPTKTKTKKISFATYTLELEFANCFWNCCGAFNPNFRSFQFMLLLTQKVS